MSPHAVRATSAPPSLPLVDLAGFGSSIPEERLKTAKQLVAACREVGFVYIINHGVPQEDLDEAFTVSEKFYNLPQEDKLKAPHPPGWAVHRGYSWPGLEKVSEAVSGAGDDGARKKDLRAVQDFKESYEVGSENDVEQPNVWPPHDVLPEWRPTMQKFYWTCFGAAKTILRALALGIGLEEDELLKLHSGDHNQLRLLNYPPISAKALEAGGGFERMPAHTDWSTITLLFQDDCGGLQVEDPRRPGKFTDVEPIEGALVMNIGDLMMRWSNDTLLSTRHRVTLPPLHDRITGEGRVTRERKSIVYFLTTDPDTSIETMGRCVDETHPAKYEPITQREYNAMKASMQY
jgi:isopenicillin N synthase-like dioxygenase